MELIGPPGCGKSTIHGELIKRRGFYGGPKDETYERIITSKLSRPLDTTYVMLPNVVTRIFQNVFPHRLDRHKSFSEFVINNRKYSIEALKQMPENEKSTEVYQRWIETVENYQSSLGTAHEDEVVCIDEGHLFRGLDVISCSATKDVDDLNKYLQLCPDIDVVVHISAPPEICLRRQNKRGWFGIPDGVFADRMTGQEWMTERVEDICRHIEDTTEIVQIENTTTIGSVVDEVSCAISPIH